MGFFSSRRDEPAVLSGSRSAFSASATGSNAKSAVQLIRSRFYGTAKAGKRKSPLEDDQGHSEHTPSITSLAESAHSRHNSAAPDHRHDHPRASSHRHLVADSLHRASTDAITTTLAQRLNELSVANSEGLLDDDEYRLLRQNLFERFSSSSAIPTETPVVRFTKSVKPRSEISSSRPKSNFHVTRTPSIRSQNSITSTVSSFIRRVTNLAKPSHSQADNASIISASSRIFPTSHTKFHRPIGRQASDTSLRTEGSRTPHDLRSISSKRTGKSPTICADANDSLTKGVTRSTRGAEPPPSSFTARHMVGGGVVEEERLKTTAGIRAEIASAEAEGRRLMDAFNGLELTALTRHRPGTHSTYVRSGYYMPDTVFALAPDSTHVKDLSGAASIQSQRSNASWPSASRSPGRPSLSQSLYLARNTSLSSIPSKDGPEVTPLRRFDSGLGSPASSSSNLVQSSLYLHPLQEELTAKPLHRVNADISTYFTESDAHVVSEDKLRIEGEDVQGDIVALEAEMVAIRARRAEVIDRYQQRLEYLRAKLKGAEIHERLLRK